MEARSGTAAITRSLSGRREGTLAGVRGVARFLRRPATIVSEVVALAGIFALSTVVSRGSVPTDPLRAERGGSLFVSVSKLLGADHVFTSPWFLALIALTLASLFVVAKDQVARAWRQGRRTPSVEALRGAPYRREAVLPGPCPDGLPAAEVHVRGSLGAWGAPLFHVGLLLVVFAGLVRALFGAEFAVDLMAGETLDPAGRRFGSGRRGLLARPFSLPEALTLEEVNVTRYPTGEPKSVSGSLRLGEGPRSSVRPVAINSPVRMGFHSVYIRAVGGTAALVEVQGAAGAERHAILLRDAGAGSAGQTTLADGTVLRAASNESGVGRVSARVDLRALRGGALAGVSFLAPGQAMTLPGGERVVLAGIVPWVQLSGQRDVSTPAVYAGLLLACVGGFLMATVVRLESAVLREAVGDGVRLVVLMRPHRFVPLYAPAFEALWEKSVADVRGHAGEDRRDPE
jgi:hypothetical protein